MTSERLASLIRDWQDETDSLAEILHGLDSDAWDTDTPAEGWQIRDQVAHLTWTEEALRLALQSPDAFADFKRAVLDDLSIVDNPASDNAPSALLASWLEAQKLTVQAVLAEDAPKRVDWFHTPMSLTTAVTARIMETFAHAQDIRDALGLPPNGSPRLRHIIHLAVIARDFSFQNHGLTPPNEDFALELEYDGDTWTWGPESSDQKITGSALDFALLATKRRNRADCDLTATGEDAGAWLDVIQAYAGPPGSGREPLPPTAEHR